MEQTKIRSPKTVWALEMTRMDLLISSFANHSNKTARDLLEQQNWGNCLSILLNYLSLWGVLDHKFDLVHYATENFAADYN